MSSKKFECVPPRVWFPARFAEQAISLYYQKRTKAIEVSTLGLYEFPIGRTTYRLPLRDLLIGLGVTVQDCQEALQ